MRSSARPTGCSDAHVAGDRLLVADPGEWRWSSTLPPDVDVSVKSVAFG